MVLNGGIGEDGILVCDGMMALGVVVMRTGLNTLKLLCALQDDTMEKYGYRPRKVLGLECCLYGSVSMLKLHLCKHCKVTGSMTLCEPT
jgi:hypothetical protein